MLDLLVALAAVSAQSLDSATVRVVVTHDGGPLRQARVTLLTGHGAPRVLPVRSGATGVTLPVSGVHRFAASAVGFLPDTFTVTLRTGLRDTTLAVALERAPAELEEVIVASTRSGRRVEEQPLRVEVLGREEIEEKLLMTPGDISMMLNETGGLRVQTTSPSLGGASVRVQGLRGRYTLLLADGLPLYGGQAGGLGLLQIPPMDLGRVEIIKGASSALYGSSALGGVVNLISRRPPPAGFPAEREMLLNATTLGGTDAIGWMSGTLADAWGWTLLAGGHRQDRRDRDGDGWTDAPGYRRAVIRPRLFHEGDGGRTGFLTSGLTVESREGGALAGAQAPDGLPFAESLRTTRADAGGDLRLPAGDLVFRVAGSGMVQHHRHRFGDVREPDTHGTWYLEATAARDLASGRGVVVGGTAVHGDRYRSEAFPGFDYDHTVPGLFAHAEAAASDRLSAALSARLDRHSRYGTFLNPRVSMLVTPVDGWSMRASAGSGFFAPTPFTEETGVTGLSRLAPLAGLRAERARSASLDVQGELGELELVATVFGSVVDHAVQARGTEAGVELVNAAGATRTHGVDLVGRWRMEPFGVTASWAWTRATEPDPAGGARREVPLTPRHTAGLVAVYEKHGATRVGLELYYTGRQELDDDPYRATSRPYLIVGALAERRFGPVRAFVNLENLGGVRQTRYAPLVRPARAPDGRWTTDAWGPLEGRVVNAGVRVEL